MFTILIIIIFNLFNYHDELFFIYLIYDQHHLKNLKFYSNINL